MLDCSRSSHEESLGIIPEAWRSEDAPFDFEVMDWHPLAPILKRWALLLANTSNAGTATCCTCPVLFVDRTTMSSPPSCSGSCSYVQTVSKTSISCPPDTPLEDTMACLSDHALALFAHCAMFTVFFGSCELSDMSQLVCGLHVLCCMGGVRNRKNAEGCNWQVQLAGALSIIHSCVCRLQARWS